MNKRRIFQLFVFFVIITMVFSGASFDDVAQANPSQKFISVLRVVYVPESWTSFDGSSWEGAALIKETEVFQWFEATIWDNDVSAVHLYKFDQTFDRFQWGILSSQDWIDYRESYCLLKVDIPEDLTPDEKSRYLREAFVMVFQTMVMDTPSQHYGIVYSGHGSPQGGLYGGQINPTDAQRLFEDMRALIGKKLDFLDAGSNCAQGLLIFPSRWYPYFDYYIASDLNVGGYTFDEEYENKYQEIDRDYQLPLLFSPDKTILESLRERLDLSRLRWEYSRNNMITGEVKQSISLYQMDQYEALVDRLYQHLPNDPIDPWIYNLDLWTYIKTLADDEVEEKFSAFRTDYLSNKDFFDWDVDSNGLKFDHLHNEVSPYFSVFPPPFAQGCPSGGTVEVPLRIRSYNGFDSPITLSAFNLPQDTSVTFSEISGTTNKMAAMTIKTGETTPSGRLTFDVLASSDTFDTNVFVQILLLTEMIYLPMMTR